MAFVIGLSLMASCIEHLLERVRSVTCVSPLAKQPFRSSACFLLLGFQWSVDISGTSALSDVCVDAAAAQFAPCLFILIRRSFREQSFLTFIPFK